MQIENTPILGGTAPRHAIRTARKLASFALRYTDSIQSGFEVKRTWTSGAETASLRNSSHQASTRLLASI